MRNKTKYVCAVVTSVVIAATALLACKDKDEEVIELVHENTIDENGLSSSIKSNISDSDKNTSVNTSEITPESQQIQSQTVNIIDENKESIYVYVCGSVKNPDVYKLCKNARVCDAIKAAGGSTGEAAIEYINLASGIYDGQKLYVPSISEIEAAIEEGKEISKAEVKVDTSLIENTVGESNNEKIVKGECDSRLININNASLQELTSIPGIGESKANKIIKYRDENGGFSSIEDIMLISGIKEGMYNKIKDYICVE